MIDTSKVVKTGGTAEEFLDMVKGGVKNGMIRSFSDGIISAVGLDQTFIGEVVNFNTKESSIQGMVLNIDSQGVKIALISGSDKQLYAGDRIYRSFKGVQTFSGFGIIGRIVNPLGICLNRKDFEQEVYTLNEFVNVRSVSVELAAPGIIEREPVRRHVHTGINSIDAMLPIGAGQRELVIGDLGSGKTTLVITIILNQKGRNSSFWRAVERAIVTQKQGLFIPCIYVVVGGRRSEMSRLKRVLQAAGSMDYTALVFTSADDLAAIQYLAPFAGCAMGEFFRNQGYRCIIVYDDLSIHAQAYRQVSLLLRRPPGREAYPGDIFYLHSRLLERAAQLKRNLGGGSLTALPVVETRSGDISGYIPTNVISITDGQIFLSMKMANQGMRPAVDLNLSVSRVGSDAQPDILKYVSKKTKIEYSLYRAFQSVEKIGGDLDPSVAKFLRKGKQILAFFKQEVHVTATLYEQVVCLHAISSGYIDDVSPTIVPYFFRLLFDVGLASTYLRNDLYPLIKHRDLLDMACLNFSFDLIEDEINGWISDFLIEFNQLYGKRALEIMGTD